MLGDRNTHITTQLSCLIKTFEDFRLAASPELTEGLLKSRKR